MATWVSRRVRACAAVTLLAAAAPAARDDRAAARVERTVRLTPAEQTAVRRGDPVVHVLERSASHEVALAGVIRVASSSREFATLAAHLPRWKHGAGVLQIGRFSAQPSLEDVASLRLDDPDLAALRRCAGRPCDVKLAALDAEEFRHFDWQAPDAAGRAEALVRAGVVRYARQYLADGDRALMVYERRGTALASEMQALLRAASALDAHAPELRAYLQEFPHRALPGVVSSLYWARESFGLKPVLSLYHVVAWPSARDGTSALVSKQIYASRYFDASLDVVVAIDADEGPGRHCYVVQTARARTDSLRGFAGRLKRPTVTREAARGMTKLLLRFARLMAEERAAAAASLPRTPSKRGAEAR